MALLAVTFGEHSVWPFVAFVSAGFVYWLVVCRLQFFNEVEGMIASLIVFFFAHLAVITISRAMNP